ncbi:hypothetical protein C2S51_036109 [Perilla frutescens var. frutescens]|nr:hypothetical protein C2S51_036109 [Perilla frutescens var. frutescens]
MKKNSRSIINSGAYTSPGTPEHGENNAGQMPKSWSSERVALPSNISSRSHVSAAALMPFNSGRALPSKWDDAERWITSPVSSYASAKTPIPQPPRRPKSKSGPLGPPGLVYLSSYSPVLEGGNGRSFMVNSPLTTGVLVPDGLSIHYDSGVVKSNSLCEENDITRSSSVPGLADLISETSGMSSSQEDAKPDGTKEEALFSHGVNHRDMATQMSPDGSTCSSSKGRLSFSALPFSGPSLLHQNAKEEVRDVQVDKGVTMARHSKKQGVKKMKGSSHIQDTILPWNASEASKNTSKLQREEAKIIAWENLQQAKAEAAIRKLEVKLEKKRSASMDRILNKLRASQMKAQAMRNLLSENDAPRARTSSHQGFSVCKYIKVNLRRNLFLCRRN